MSEFVLLGRDQILSAEDLEYEIVDVPEWGGKVRVRALTGSERDQFEASLVKEAGKIRKIDTANIRAKLVSLSIVDGEGNRLFGESDIALLGQKSAAALDRVFESAQKLSKISKEDVEELEGNSEVITSGDS